MITEYVLRFLEMIGNQGNPSISFHYLVRNFAFNNRNRLKLFLENLFQDENKQYLTLTYIFCTDAYLLDINIKFLQHNYLTDIITFNLADKANDITGEIYISIDRVKENSTLLHQPFQKELHRVIFHGALHLCGYRDKSRSEITLMRQKEAFYLEKYFNPESI